MEQLMQSTRRKFRCSVCLEQQPEDFVARLWTPVGMISVDLYTSTYNYAPAPLVYHIWTRLYNHVHLSLAFAFSLLSRVSHRLRYATVSITLLIFTNYTYSP